MGTRSTKPLVNGYTRGGAPPTSQYANLNLLVSGLPVSVKAPHAKVRRDGYRQSARRSRTGDRG